MKSNDRPLGDVVKEILRKYKLEDHLEETQMIENWGKTVGSMIAAHTGKLSVKDHILFVTVDTAALRQELLYRKETLLSLLNKSAGRDIIRDIVFR